MCCPRQSWAWGLPSLERGDGLPEGALPAAPCSSWGFADPSLGGGTRFWTHMPPRNQEGMRLFCSRADTQFAPSLGQVSHRASGEPRRPRGSPPQSCTRGCTCSQTLEAIHGPVLVTQRHVLAALLWSGDERPHLAPSWAPPPFWHSPGFGTEKGLMHLHQMAGREGAASLPEPVALAE